MITHRGVAHRWFAWQPVDTEDRGWRWLRVVWRRRIWEDMDGLIGTVRYWRYPVDRSSL